MNKDYKDYEDYVYYSQDHLTHKLNRFSDMVSSRNDPKLVSMFNEVLDEIKNMYLHMADVEYTQMSIQLHHHKFIEELISIKKLKQGAYKTYKQLRRYRREIKC